MRVVVAMSGGVDSSVAAAILRDEGHEVIGLTMRLHDDDPAAAARPASARAGTCCSPNEIHRAKDVCDLLGVPHYTVDERARFRAQVIDDFAREYAAGRTPNPCVRCNEHVKFAPLLARARALGAELLVTGHYARSEGGALLRGVDPAKDQSYFLFAMGAEALASVRFPLGTWRKEQVRERARALGLPSADAPDSQELCFVGGGSASAVAARRAAELELDVDALAPGPIVDAAGRVLGEHDGIHTVTIGQRRGLRIAGSAARYVLRVLPERREVVVGDAEDLEVRTIRVDDLHRLAPLGRGPEAAPRSRSATAHAAESAARPSGSSATSPASASTRRCGRSRRGRRRSSTRAIGSSAAAGSPAASRRRAGERRRRASAGARGLARGRRAPVRGAAGPPLDPAGPARRDR
ncbi:MAG: tRNA 2-thiouridine(34) synthase MnmA [Nannocystaceae bacterium]